MIGTYYLRSMAIITLFWAPPNVQAQKAESDAFDPATNNADAVRVTDTWAIWHTQELIEETRGHVAQSFVHRFYLQRLSESKASLAITLRDTSTAQACKRYARWNGAALEQNASVALSARRNDQNIP